MQKTDIKYSLRNKTVEDFDNIYQIKKNALGEYIKLTWGWDEELQLKMHKDEFENDDIQLIILNGQVAGTVCINENGNEVTIMQLYIIDKFQSKGLGSKIMNDILAKHKGKVIKLGVLKINDRARKLYEKFGFQVHCEENQYYKMTLSN